MRRILKLIILGCIACIVIITAGCMHSEQVGIKEKAVEADNREVKSLIELSNSVSNDVEFDKNLLDYLRGINKNALDEYFIDECKDIKLREYEIASEGTAENEFLVAHDDENYIEKVWSEEERKHRELLDMYDKMLIRDDDEVYALNGRSATLIAENYFYNDDKWLLSKAKIEEKQVCIGTGGVYTFYRIQGLNGSISIRVKWFENKKMGVCSLKYEE